MKLTKIQKTTRFLVHTAEKILLLSFLTGILPVFVAGQIYQIFC